MYDVSVNYTGNAQCPPLKTSTGEVIQPGHT